MNVLSLFDGMSCGRIALERAGIPVEKYYASELDKYAIQVTQANWPETIQLGDVTKWREWSIDWASIDLLIGGSPCQGFSFAGKQLAFDDPRSKLFFVYVDILNHIKALNPRVKFMLENVKMKKEYLAVISEQLGVEPVFINSALVSAQNRQRYYWANWHIEQPEDKGIVLADILESDADGYIKNRGEMILRSEKSQCLDANYHKGVDNHGQRTMIKCGQMVGRKINPETGKRDDYNAELKTIQRIEIRKDNKTNCLSTVQKDNLIVYGAALRGRDGATNLEIRKDNKSNSILSDGHQSRLIARSYNRNDGVGKKLDKAYPLNATDWRGLNRNQNQNCATDGLIYRKLTPIECERLQTVPDNYTNHVSNTQRYKMLGNGWTIDVIAHIFSTMAVTDELTVNFF